MITRALILFLLLAFSWTQSMAVVCGGSCEITSSIKVSADKSETMPDCHSSSKKEEKNSQEKTSDCCVNQTVPPDSINIIGASKEVESKKLQIKHSFSNDSLSMLGNSITATEPPRQGNIFFSKTPIYLLLSRLKILNKS